MYETPSLTSVGGFAELTQHKNGITKSGPSGDVLLSGQTLPVDVTVPGVHHTINILNVLQIS